MCRKDPSDGTDVISATALPAILFACDFPPSNSQGGPVQAVRLLANYPNDKLVVLSGSCYVDSPAPNGLLNCLHILFPLNNETGRWGIGRLKTAICWLRIPLLSWKIVRLLKRNQIKAMLSIAHGYFFIAAALAS